MSARRFYAGRADIALHAAETGAYRDNLATGAPALWVVLRPTDADPPYELFAVTADPSEGEAMTEAGNNIVEPVPMPEPIREIGCGVRRRAPCRASVLQAQARPRRSGIAGAAARLWRSRRMSDEDFLKRWSRRKRDVAKRRAGCAAGRRCRGSRTAD